MITETAHLTIDPARAAEFEQAVAQASVVLRAAEGCRSMELERLVEDPAGYQLRVDWESVDHHKRLFRQSEGFTRWRALAGPFFAAPPVVDYSEAVERFF